MGGERLRSTMHANHGRRYGVAALPRPTGRARARATAQMACHEPTSSRTRATVFRFKLRTGAAMTRTTSSTTRTPRYGIYLATVADEGAKSRVYNIGSGVGVTLRDFEQRDQEAHPEGRRSRSAAA